MNTSNTVVRVLIDDSNNEDTGTDLLSIRY